MLQTGVEFAEKVQIIQKKCVSCTEKSVNFTEK